MVQGRLKSAASPQDMDRVAAQPSGVISIDAGAVAALERGKELLAAG